MSSCQITIDYGTNHVAIAYAIFQDDARISQPTMLLVRGKFEEPAMATWLEDGTFVHGFELRDLAKNNASVSDKVMILFKMALSAEPDALKLTIGAHDVLIEEGRTMEELFQCHIQAIVSDTKKRIRDMESSRCTQKLTVRELDDMLAHLRVRITVPDSWTPHALDRMQTAAEKAGLTHVVLASESKAVIAYLVDKASNETSPLRAAFNKGDIIITADIGCGTADCVANQLEDNLSLDCRIKTLGHSSGDICGSAQVDFLLHEWLMENSAPDWSAKIAEKLGVTPRDFVRRTLNTLSKMKEEFDEFEEMAHGIIPGLHGRYETVSIPREEIFQALNDVIDDNICLINEQIKPHQFPDALLMSGGFTACAYAMRRFREQYEPRNIIVMRPSDTDKAGWSPVAIGALLRYKNVMDQHLPEKYGYAILQRQEFNKQNPDPAHADSWTRHETSGKRSFMPWVLPSDLDHKVFVVDDRIRTIIAQGEMADNVRHINMQFHVPISRPHITAEFVCLSKKFADSAASQRCRLPGEEFKQKYITHDDVHKWREVDMELPQDKLEAHDFPQHIAEDGEVCWVLNVLVIVSKSAHGMGVEFKILKPVQQQDEVAVKLEGGGSAEAYWDYVFQGEVAFRVKDAALWDGKHSPFTED